MDLTPEEQASFDELAARARQLEPEDRELEAPPPDVWEGIQAALADVDAIPDTDADTDTDTDADTDTEAPEASADVVQLAARSPRTYLWLVGVAAVLLLLVLGGWLLTAEADDDVIGRTDLQALDETGAVVGDARLIDDDGELRLRIDTEPIEPGDDGYLEVWVIDPDITELVSLGPVRPDGTYDLPPGIDPERFPIVDISREPLNGDPTHSGDSVVQGQLQFV
jgi:hypothetical protein